MKFTYKWNEEKNSLLKRTRNISFEEIVVYLEAGKIVKILEHHNKDKYVNQKIYLININNYIYQVPYVIDYENKWYFLKTIIPDRKLTKKYLITSEVQYDNR